MQAQARADYGKGISDHIMKLESTLEGINFLDRHKVSAEYRSKMVDWMVEVLSTFKCSDQAFFKTIQLMDRYYAEIGATLGTSTLHMTGVVAMFIATKYEDIIPLLLRTIINKVGHNKFTKKQVMEKELEMLRVFKYSLGAPTVLEHLERMSAELGIADNHQIQVVFTYLAKMACHNYELSQLSASELAGSVAYVGLKICEKQKGTVKSDAALKKLTELCQLNVKLAKANGRVLLNFAKAFDKTHPTLKNLKATYAEELKQI
jgi:hypothetical protein